MHKSLMLSAVTATAAALLLPAAFAAAVPVVAADYSSDFALTGDPAARNGWSYLWNANGPLGTPANYVPLAVENGQYEPAGTPAGAGALGIGSAPVDPVKFPQNPPPDPFGSGAVLPPLPNTYVRPGLGLQQDAGGVERAGIIAYTFNAEEIAAASEGGTTADAFITDYYFAVSSTAADAMSARVYTNNTAPPLEFFFPAGFAFQTTLDPRPIPLGTYAAGETIYIALGSVLTDQIDEMRLDLTITLVPEPAALSLVALAGLPLLGRRARRSRL